MKITLAILCFSCIMLSCNVSKNKDDNKPFSKLDFSNGEFKLYIYTIPEFLDGLYFSDFQKENKNFYIKDNEALQKIQKELIVKQITKYKSSGSSYIIRLVHDNELVDGGVVDIGSSIFHYYNAKYLIDSTVLRSLKEYFIPMPCYLVNCKTISGSKKYYEYITKSNSGFIHTGTKDGEICLNGFSGCIEVTTSPDNFDFENRQEIINKDFKHLGKVKLYTANYNGGDSVYIKILCNKDFSNNLPPNYKLCSSFTDTLDFPQATYDVDSMRILNFFKNEGIRDYDILEIK